MWFFPRSTPLQALVYHVFGIGKKHPPPLELKQRPSIESAVKASATRRPSRAGYIFAAYLDTGMLVAEWKEADNCMEAVGPKMVLCVDDEVIGLRVRKIMLESHGFQVLTASNGQQGLSLFDQNPVDLVVLDYYMPGLNGAEVAAEMRRRRPQVPIIFLSAYFSLPPAALELADAFLTKGDPPDVLIERIERLV
jgi:CheY-like chemotaxis protein